MNTKLAECKAREYRPSEYKAREYKQREYFVGLDLGQKQDYTAIAVLERAEIATGEIDGVTYERKLETHYGLRFLQRVRLGTSYPAIVERVREVVGAPDVVGRCTLVPDATCVGGPVMDLLHAARLGCPIVPVVITSGERSRYSDGTWRVPKRDLVIGLQVMFEERKLEIAASLPDAATLMTELMRQLWRDKSCGAREGPHDDLVLAVALAVWRAKGWERRDIFINRSLGMVTG
jgi:hypothetical protein